MITTQNSETLPTVDSSAHPDVLVNREDFLFAFKAAGWASTRHNEIPILRCILIEASGNKLTLTGTDLETWFSVPVPALSSEEVHAALAIPKGGILPWLQDLTTATIALRFDGNKLHFTGEHSESESQSVSVTGMSAESFPEIPEPGTGEAIEIPGAVLRAGVQTRFAISKDESRFTLNAGLLQLTDHCLRFVATDGHRLALQEHPVVTETIFRSLLPRRALQVLALYFEDRPPAVVGLSIQQSSCTFSFGDAYLWTRKVKGGFPDWEKLIKPPAHSFEIPDVALLTSALQRVSRFSDERSRAIRLTIGHGELTALSSISETGEARETLPIDFEAPKTSIALNIDYLLDALRRVGTPATFSFSGPTEQIVISDCDGFSCLIMPVRIPGST
jgi:DNA polymerase-3 subunit beta